MVVASLKILYYILNLYKISCIKDKSWNSSTYLLIWLSSPWVKLSNSASFILNVRNKFIFYSNGYRLFKYLSFQIYFKYIKYKIKFLNFKHFLLKNLIITVTITFCFWMFIIFLCVCSYMYWFYKNCPLIVNYNQRIIHLMLA